jgi:hypothetical protein
MTRQELHNWLQPRSELIEKSRTMPFIKSLDPEFVKGLWYNTMDFFKIRNELEKWIKDNGNSK